MTDRVRNMASSPSGNSFCAQYGRARRCVHRNPTRAVNSLHTVSKHAAADCADSVQSAARWMCADRRLLDVAELAQALAGGIVERWRRGVSPRRRRRRHSSTTTSSDAAGALGAPSSSAFARSTTGPAAGSAGAAEPDRRVGDGDAVDAERDLEHAARREHVEADLILVARGERPDDAEGARTLLEVHEVAGLEAQAVDRDHRHRRLAREVEVVADRSIGATAEAELIARVVEPGAKSVEGLLSSARPGAARPRFRFSLGSLSRS